MKKTLLAVALASSLTSFGAVAADKAPEPSYTVSGNIGLVSDYRFRGVSQTNKKPAAQGGLDLALSNGLSFGTWTSNVSKWANPGGAQEIDVYGGYTKNLLGLDLSLGGIQYLYPRNTATTSNNTFEYYVGLGYGPVSAKVWVGNGNWFGIDSNGSTYTELNYTFSLSEKVSVTAHIGKQAIDEVDASKNYGFLDGRVAVSYDLGDGLAVSLAASKVKFKNKTDSEGAGGWYLGGSNGQEKLGGSAVVASITKTF